MDDETMREIERLAREQPLEEEQARRFYGRILDALYAGEPRVLREAELELLLAERRRRLDEEH